MTPSPNKTLTVISLLICTLASAQVAERRYFLNVTERPFLHVSVKDKNAGVPMRGATVFLSHGADTVKTVTDDNGIAVFLKHPFAEADSIVLDISYLGYRKLTHRHVMKPVLALNALMEEDPQQLNAIVVEGDNVAMIRHGDTTIYNASTFVTMEGARLSDLLKKLPGVTVSENSVSAYGETVSKILINGTMLFQDDVASAIDMLMSADVKKIRVYDEHPRDRLVGRDTLGKKERVMDVQTKKAMTKAQELVLLALGGVFVDDNSDVGGTAGGVEENWRTFAVDRPAWIVNAGAGHNYSVKGANNTVATSPEDQAYADLRVSRNKPFGSMMSHLLKVTASGRESSSEAENVYSPTTAFSTKRDRERNVHNNGDIDAFYSGSQSFTIKENTSIGASLNLGFKRAKTSGAFDFSSVTDGTEAVMSRMDISQSNSYRAGGGVSFSHFFKKDGRKLSADMECRFSRGKGDEERADTMATSTSPQWLTIGNSNSSDRYGLSLSYEEPLIGKNFRLKTVYALSGDFSKTRKLSFDELLKRQDIVNTQDFTYRDIDNKVIAGLDWTTDDRAFRVAADVIYTRKNRLRDEHFPDEFVQPDTWQQVSPALDLNYSRNGFSVNATYSESLRIPSVEQSRGTIDNASSISLRAGNPSLKASTTRNVMLQVRGLHAKSNSSFNLLLMFAATSGSIVDKIQYFSDATYLPDYGYTAPAGSSLTTPVNVNGEMDFSANAGWDFYSNALKSSFMTSLGYKFGSKPFMTGELLQTNDTHGLDLDVHYISGFSRYVEIMASTGIGLGKELMDNITFYNSLNWNLDLDVKVNFLKRFFVGTELGTSLFRTTMEGLGYDQSKWDMYLSCKLGKKKNSELILACEDILNSSLNIMNLVLDNYVRTTHRTVLGRSICLSYKFTFR